MSRQAVCVRYWAGDSLKGCRDPRLAEKLPSLLGNPELRTSALTKLAIENRVDSLHDLYFDLLGSDCLAQGEWQRSALEYLSVFPQPQDRERFRRILRDNPDPFSRRSSALGLGQLRDEGSVELIVEAMRKEPPNDLNARTYLVALGKVKGAKARQILESYRSSPIEQVRQLVEGLLQDW